MKHIISKTLFRGFPYLVILALFRLAPQREMRLLLWLVWWIMVDITHYAVEFKPTKITGYSLPILQKLFQEKKISIRYYLAIINRIYLFPILLTVYLIYLLIDQTQLRDLHLSVWFLVADETVLLILTILSWVMLVYQEEKDKKFETTRMSMEASFGYYGLSIILWLLSTYIIYQQVQDLDTIWSVISVIAGVLVFLVGVLLMEEDGEEA